MVGGGGGFPQSGSWCTSGEVTSSPSSTLEVKLRPAGQIKTLVCCFSFRHFEDLLRWRGLRFFNHSRSGTTAAHGVASQWKMIGSSSSGVGMRNFQSSLSEFSDSSVSVRHGLMVQAFIHVINSIHSYSPKRVCDINKHTKFANVRSESGLFNP